MNETDFTDHQFAAWLRKANAIDNWEHVNSFTNHWYNKKGEHVATAIYDNANCTRRIFIR